MSKNITWLLRNLEKNSTEIFLYKLVWGTFIVLTTFFSLFIINEPICTPKWSILVILHTLFSTMAILIINKGYIQMGAFLYSSTAIIFSFCFSHLNSSKDVSFLCSLLAIVLFIGVGLGRRSLWLFFLIPIFYCVILLLNWYSYNFLFSYLLNNKGFIAWLISVEAILFISGVGISYENSFAKLSCLKFQKKISTTLSEQKYRSIFESLYDVYYQTDLMGKITMISPSIKLRAGYEPEEIIGKSVTEFYANPNSRKIFISQLTENGEVHDYETELVTKNGNVKHVEVSSKIIYGVNNTPIGIEGTIHDISLRKLREKKLKEKTENIKLLSAHMQNNYEEQRTRFSRVIHDELGQQLTAIKIEALSIKNSINEMGSQMDNRFLKLIENMDNSIEKLRKIGTELRPGILDDLGLLSAIEWQGQEFEYRTGIKFKFNTPLKELNPDVTFSINVFRIFQEALSNIERHAEASCVEATMKLTDGFIHFEISDNGTGFDLELGITKGKFGLLGIFERISLLNGYISIVSTVGKGTQIILNIPITIN